MKKNKSGFILLPLVFIVLIISVVGYFLINKKSTINGIGQTLATPTSIANSENIDGWKSYTNSAYNYSIQHPSDWKIEINCFGGSAESKIVCLESPNLEADAFPKVVKGGVIQIFGKSDGDGSVGLGYSLDQFCNSQGGTDEKPSYCNETNINGNPVVERGFVNLPFIDIGFLDKNKKIFLSIRMEAKNDTKDVAYQIVKSFKFTNDVQTDNWKSYTNTTYGYSIKFPQEFKSQDIAAGVGNIEASPNATNIYIYNSSDAEQYLNRYISIEFLQLEPGNNINDNFNVYKFRTKKGFIEIMVTKDKSKSELANKIYATFKSSEDNSQ